MSPLHAIYSLCVTPGKIIRFVRGCLLTRKLTYKSLGAGIVLNDAFLPVTISIGQGAKFELHGRLSLESWNGLRQGIYISIGNNSKLSVKGDFILGPGCRIILEPNAELSIGGRKCESAAGLTERCLIMVRKHVNIGTDLICSWGTYITDCDWHEITGIANTAETIIGDHVWIAPNCSILKGSIIGSGCIVATAAVAHKTVYPNNCLIGGIPARVLSKNRVWSRDLIPI